MAQAKKKTATKTAKKCATRTAAKKKCCTKSCKKSGLKYEKYQKGQASNPFFVITMSVLAATLLFANLIMMTV